jgi:hypothetical protein
MKTYLAQFYTVTSTVEKTYGGYAFTVADFDESSLNEELVIEKFVARANANKDKRYQKQAEWERGYVDELARIRSYQAAYEQFFAYLDSGAIGLTAWDYDMTGMPWLQQGGAYSINLCPAAPEGEKPAMENLKNDLYYRTGEEGKTYTTAVNMNLLFFELEGLDGDFKYENILLVNDIVSRHLKKA